MSFGAIKSNHSITSIYILAKEKDYKKFLKIRIINKIMSNLYKVEDYIVKIINFKNQINNHAIWNFWSSKNKEILLKLRSDSQTIDLHQCQLAAPNWEKHGGSTDGPFISSIFFPPPDNRSSYCENNRTRKFVVVGDSVLNNSSLMLEYIVGIIFNILDFWLYRFTFLSFP